MRKLNVRVSNLESNDSLPNDLSLLPWANYYENKAKYQIRIPLPVPVPVAQNKVGPNRLRLKHVGV